MPWKKKCARQPETASDSTAETDHKKKLCVTGGDTLLNDIRNLPVRMYNDFCSFFREGCVRIRDRNKK